MIASRYRPPPWRLASVACLCLAAFFAAGPIASAGPVTIEAALQIGSPPFTWNVVATDPGGSVFKSSYTIGNFTLTNAQAAMTDNPADLTSSTFHITHSGTGPDTLLLAVTAAGFTKPVGNVSMISTVSGTNATGALTNLAYQSTLDLSNRTDHTAFGPDANTKTLGAQFGFDVGDNFSDAKKGILPGLVTGPYSMIQLFQITMAGDGTVVSLGGETLLAQAPEPASMTLFGIGVAGMIGYGWRRRRQNLAQNTATSAVA